ncbi:MAG: ThuA domain-containing protein [Opitutaceae bacterium]|nr:ThuA domain-containing protein [Opitutaceae bacterium]
MKIVHERGTEIIGFDDAGRAASRVSGPRQEVQTTSRARSHRNVSIMKAIRLVLLALIWSGVAAFAAAAPKRVLVVTVTTGFRHSSIPVAEQTLARLAVQSGGEFTVDFVHQPEGAPKFIFAPQPGAAGPAAPEFQSRLKKYEEDKRVYDAAFEKWLPKAKASLEALRPANLADYDAVVFASTTGDLPLPDKQGFIDWVAAGHGFVGMHAAADTFHGFPAFVEMLGGEFQTHGPQVRVDCLNRDPSHPATVHLPPSWSVFDEIYEFKNHDPASVHHLLDLDQHPQSHVPGEFPVSWGKMFGQGRVFYTSLGHREDVWDAAATTGDTGKNTASVAARYQLHVLGGLRWALGLAKGSVESGVTPVVDRTPKPDYAPLNPPGDYIVTPAPASEPRINGARVFGVRPGSEFLFTVPATGEAPLTYSAAGLPGGLAIDAATGRITGVIEDRTPKMHRVVLRVTNACGTDERELRIVVGDRIALTPPLGWNSWNSWARAIDEPKVRATAEAMARHLKGHGWTYVNIDDTWQGVRGGPFQAIQPNEKFPDMKRLADDVHALGLKLGIYSTPWIASYADHIGGSADTADGFWQPGLTREQRGDTHRIGAHRFEAADARQWAEWGIDYLKYDWLPNDIPATVRMGEALAAQPRDIVYSLSNTAPFSHAPEYARLANAWRTTGDIRDDWNRGTRNLNQFKGIYDIWLMQERWARFTGPGHWPDPDMLVVGKVGWGPLLRPSKLSPDEQYTHISLWCLWSAPLLIGCPIEDMDSFTLNLLTNDEVLAVNQDPLGRMAVTIFGDGDRQVLAKPLEDGSVVVGLFNRGSAAQAVTVTWDMLAFDGLPEHAKLWNWELTATGRNRRFSCSVRDLWRQQDVGVFKEQFTAVVPTHGVVLLSVRPANP